jgi:general L-amino acid transport system substrate-binding protein
MMAGEELNITSANVKSLAGKDNKNKEINRLLGKDPLQGLSKLGLSADWAVQVISQVGNYAEVFEKNLGMSTPLKIARGANQFFDSLIIPSATPRKVAKIIPKKATNPVFNKPTIPALR